MFKEFFGSLVGPRSSRPALRVRLAVEALEPRWAADANYTWTGAASGAWENAANWTGGDANHYPGDRADGGGVTHHDGASFPQAGKPDCALGVELAQGVATLKAQGNWAGTLTLNDQLIVNGTFEWESAATISVAANESLTLYKTSDSSDWIAGTITGSGEMTLEGTSGTAQGTLKITGAANTLGCLFDIKNYGSCTVAHQSQRLTLTSSAFIRTEGLTGGNGQLKLQDPATGGTGGFITSSSAPYIDNQGTTDIQGSSVGRMLIGIPLVNNHSTSYLHLEGAEANFYSSNSNTALCSVYQSAGAIVADRAGGVYFYCDQGFEMNGGVYRIENNVVNQLKSGDGNDIEFAAGSVYLGDQNTTQDVCTLSCLGGNVVISAISLYVNVDGNTSDHAGSLVSGDNHNITINGTINLFAHLESSSFTELCSWRIFDAGTGTLTFGTGGSVSITSDNSLAVYESEQIGSHWMLEG